MARTDALGKLCSDYFFLGEIGCGLNDLYEETSAHDDWPEHDAITSCLDTLNSLFELAKTRLEKERKALCQSEKN